MTTLAELKTKADNLGIDRGIVRLYGDLRKISTWEQAITSHQTVTVEAETIIDEPETVEEIIPFTHDHPSRREMALEELDRMRKVFEPAGAVDCPPPPPIIRPCPMPESPGIPGIEIAKRESPRPGEGRGDERFRNLGDRLFSKIKEDILRYFEGIKEDLQTCFDLNYLENEDHYKEIVSLVELMEWNINNKYSIYDIWGTVPYFKREGFQKLIPFGIHEFFKDSCLRVDHWECTYQTYWFVCEKPAPIPTLSEPYGGIFIPNKMHELGRDIYLWKFPGMVQAENFFFEITGASTYCMVPAKSDFKINLNQPVLVGV